MRTLSATLLAAMAERVRRPALTLTVERRFGGVALLDWTLLGQGHEAPGPVALAQLTNGAIVRARIVPGTGQVFVQSIPSPGAGAPWTRWPVVLRAGGDGAARAIALWTTSGGVAAVRALADGRVIVAESIDGGTTWSGAVTLATTAPPPAAVAGAAKPDGTTLVIWDTGSSLRYRVRTGGVWGAEGEAASLGGACTGLAAHHRDDFAVLVAGRDAAGDSYLWQAFYGDGGPYPAGTWSGLDPILPAGAGSAVQYADPTLAFADTYRFFYREASTNTPPRQRVYWSHHQPGEDIVSGWWRDPAPFAADTPYGPALAYTTGDHAYLAMYNAVWRAAIVPEIHDLSADLRRVVASYRLFGGWATIDLANDGGRYPHPDAAAGAPVAIGAQLALSLGYQTAAGAETSAFPPLWVTATEYRSDRPNRADFVLTAEDAWWILGRWTARRSFAWAVGERNVYQLLAFLFARAGLPFTTENASADLADLAPAFTIHPGDTGMQVARRLLALVPDYLRMRATGAVAGDLAPAGSPLAAWGAGVPLLAARFRSAVRHFNQIQLYGDGVTGEAFDFAEIGRVINRLHQVHDRNVTTIDLAASRAAAYLRDETLQATTDTITIPVHPGLEILDPVAVTDARAGLTDAPRRVLGLALTYDPARGRYDEEITLGQGE